MPFISGNEIIEHFSIMDNEMLSIASAIKLLSQQYSEDDANEVTRQYCLYTSKSTKQRVCLGFLYMNHYDSDLQTLVIKNKSSLNKLNQKWAEVFQILIDRRSDYDQTETYHQRLNRIQTTDAELTCLIELTRLTLYYDQGSYHKMAEFDDVHYHYFGEMKDEYLVDCFHLKVYQHLFTFFWTRNELILARKYAFRALNRTGSPFTQASIHMNLGLTYLFDTYQQGMYHLNHSLKIAEVHGYDDIYHMVKEICIPFVSAHFKQVKGVTSKDKGEQAHIEIAKGNHDKAIGILKDEPLDTPCKLYYLGLAKRDEKILHQAYSAFVQKQNMYFFARLPLQALKKLRI